jgi:hypothetical protein
MRNISKRRHDGKRLIGFPVTDSQFIGISTLDELETNGLKRPTTVEDSKVKDRKGDSKLQAAHEVREQVQRRFDSLRRRRSHAFAGYLNELRQGLRMGSTAPLTLYTPHQGEIDEESGDLVLDHAAPLVNVDGETQTEARFILRETDADTGADPVAFVLHHGIDARYAGTIMHDVNFYARPVTETKIAVLNANGLLTKTVIDVIKELDIPSEQIARLTPTPNKKQVASWLSLIAGAAGALVGREITDNFASAIAKLNAQINGIDPEESIKPFLRHALALAQADPAIGKANKLVWALAGGHYHDTGELLDAPRWIALQNGFNAKLAKGTPRAKQVKRANAFRAIGVELPGSLI